MRQLFSNDSGKTTWLDHLLSLVAGSLVLFSVGQGISRTDVGATLLEIFIGGKVFSWLFGTFFGDRSIAKWDGYFYLAIGLLAIFSNRNLNISLGDNPFDGVFGSLGLLAWLLALGSFASWRDGTLLFQAVPGIAAFGLIGCFDTFRPVTYYFFGFLLCIATLFARINARVMLGYAVASGSPLVAHQKSPMAALRKGPWRSVAGPTWALLSAGVIVLTSFIAAPLVQESVQSVVTHIHIPLPRAFRQSGTEGFFRANNFGELQVGKGPITLGEDPVLRIQMDGPRYLRSATYLAYTGRGWRSFTSDAADEERPNAVIQKMAYLAQQEIHDPQRVDFTVEMLTSRGGTLPTPGEMPTLPASQDLSINPDGTISLAYGARLQPLAGSATVPSDNAKPTTAQIDLTPTARRLYMSVEGVPERILKLARSAAANLTTDFDKAESIKNEIAGRMVYDLQATAVPEGRDAVEFSLLEAKRGYCDVFASAMVVMARAIHIPARYVVGFFPFDERPDSAGRYTIREKHAHAWAELYFRNVGWVVFDATENAEQADGAGRGQETGAFGWLHAWWFYAVVATSGVAALTFGFLRLRGYMARPRNKARDRIEKLYKRFSRALERQGGWVRAPYQAPEEYLEALRPHLNGAYDLASSLTREFLVALYGRHLPDDSEYASLVQRVQALERLPKKGK